MKLLKGITLIVLVFCSLVVLAKEKQNIVKELQEKPQEEESRLSPGQPCIDFSFSNIDGKTVSLKNLRGKYVYIDVWATWCGPCKAQIPALQKLEKEMEGKKIVFVSISCDDNKKMWEEYVKKEKLGGVQLIMEGEKAEEFSRFFEIEMIPRFILLDKKGKIVNAKMGRPSVAGTKDELMKLKGI